MLLVFLNFLQIMLFMWLLVLISVVLMIVSELFFLMLCVVLKKCFGCCSVFVLILFVSILFDVGIMVLYVCVRCVIELSRIMMLCFILMRCLVFLIIILVICMWCVVGLLNVDVIILLVIECCILVIFFGCLLISSMNRIMFGWFCLIVCVMCWSIMVLLDFGDVMSRLCWFLLIGVIMLMMWFVMFFLLCILCLSDSGLFGCSGVRFLNMILCFEVLGGCLLILLIFISVKQCLLFFGVWILFLMVLLVCRLKWWICDGLMQMLLVFVRYDIFGECRKLKLFGSILSVLLLKIVFFVLVCFLRMVNINFCLCRWFVFLIFRLLVILISLDMCRDLSLDKCIWRICQGGEVMKENKGGG